MHLMSHLAGAVNFNKKPPKGIVTKEREKEEYLSLKLTLMLTGKIARQTFIYTSN